MFTSPLYILTILPFYHCLLFSLPIPIFSFCIIHHFLRPLSSISLSTSVFIDIGSEISLIYLANLRRNFQTVLGFHDRSADKTRKRLPQAAFDCTEEGREETQEAHASLVCWPDGWPFRITSQSTEEPSSHHPRAPHTPPPILPLLKESPVQPQWALHQMDT